MFGKNKEDTVSFYAEETSMSCAPPIAEQVEWKLREKKQAKQEKRRQRVLDDLLIRIQNEYDAGTLQALGETYKNVRGY